MHTRYCPAIFSTLAIWAAAASISWAAGRVELELVAEERVPLTAQQDWLRRLGQAGVTGLRIRVGRLGDKAGIEVRGTEDRPVYMVTGLLTAAGEVRLPGQRFKPNEAARLIRWLDELAREGLPQEREEKSAFGLDRQVFEQVLKDLTRPVGVSTAGITRREAIEKISRQLVLPLQINPKQLPAMADEKLSDELLGVSSGTALAYILRPLGLSMVPRESGGRRAHYAVIEARDDQNQKVWPVGWPPEKPRREVMPALFEFLTVNIQGVSVAQALDAVAKRMKVPVLVDRSALARHNIDPTKIPASLPRARLSYSILLRKILFQAKLKSEVRLDEAGNPLLWITTIKQ